MVKVSSASTFIAAFMPTWKSHQKEQSVYINIGCNL